MSRVLGRTDDIVGLDLSNSSTFGDVDGIDCASDMSEWFGEQLGALRRDARLEGWADVSEDGSASDGDIDVGLRSYRAHLASGLATSRRLAPLPIKSIMPSSCANCGVVVYEEGLRALQSGISKPVVWGTRGLHPGFPWFS